MCFLLIFFLLIVGGLYSCKNLNSDLPPESLQTSLNENIESKNTVPEEFVILGKKKINPYSIININKALKELDFVNKPKKLDANYLYVRLEPMDSLGTNFLMQTKEIFAHAVPLDYKLENNGIKYKEPNYYGKEQVFWAAIPIAYKLPTNIKVQIIEELFLPLGDGHEGVFVEGYEDGFLKALDSKTLELFDEDNIKNKKAKVSAIGSGTLKVFDDFVNVYLGIKGVEIKMKRWFTTRYALTDQYGDFSNTTYNFNGPVDCSLVWLTNDFEVKNGTSQAILGQNNVSGAWVTNINKSTATSGTLNSTPVYIFAHVFRAAYNYYYNNTTYGIKTPPKANFAPLGSNRLNIKCQVSNPVGSHFFFTNGGGLLDPSVVIVSDPNIAADISSRRIFATTTHELAHASHWELGLYWYDYGNSKKKATLAESWAMGVEWVITNHVYSNLAALYGLPWTSYERPDRATQTKPINYWLYYDSGSTVSNNRDDFYTPVFIDLMDLNNQSFQTPDPLFNPYFNSLPNTTTKVLSLCPNDQASGFSLSFLESKLAINTTSWVGLKNTLISTNPTNSTSAQIQYLFDNYEN